MPLCLLSTEVTISWEMDMYSVEEDDGQGLMVCAVLNGSTEIYPLVGFMTTTTANDSGENMKT